MELVMHMFNATELFFYTERKQPICPNWPVSVVIWRCPICYLFCGSDSCPSPCRESDFETVHKLSRFSLLSLAFSGYKPNLCFMKWSVLDCRVAKKPIKLFKLLWFLPFSLLPPSASVWFWKGLCVSDRTAWTSNPSVSISQMLGSQLCATVPSFIHSSQTATQK